MVYILRWGAAFTSVWRYNVCRQ